MDESVGPVRQLVQLLLLPSEFLPPVLPQAADARVQQIDQVHKENLRGGVWYIERDRDIRLGHG